MEGKRSKKSIVGRYFLLINPGCNINLVLGFMRAVLLFQDGQYILNHLLFNNILQNPCLRIRHNKVRDEMY